MPKNRYYVKQPDHIRLFFRKKTTSQPSEAVVMLNEERPLLAKRWPEMAAKIQKRLLGEGKITKEMIESYVDAYAGIYGDDTDAYVEEIVADTYAGMNRTDYGTNQLRADVKVEVGQWQKKSGSARAPPAKYSMVGRGENV